MISMPDYLGNDVVALVRDYPKSIVSFSCENDIPIEQLDFSPRTRNVLRYNKVMTLSRILSMEEAEFMSLNMMSEACANEIRLTLAEYLENNSSYIRSVPLSKPEPEVAEDLASNRLLSSQESRRRIIEALKTAGQLISLEGLELSARAYGCMKRIKIDDISGIIELYPEGFWKIKNVGKKTIEELLLVTETYVEKHMELIEAYLTGEDISRFASVQEDHTSAELISEEAGIEQLMSEADITELFNLAATRKVLTDFIAENDIPIENLSLSSRAYNALKRAGAKTLSGLLSFYPDGFSMWKNVGAKTIQELKDTSEKFADQMRQKYLEYITFGDPNLPDAKPQEYPEEYLRKLVLDCFDNVRFSGLHYADIRDNCPGNVQEEQLKQIIGRLISEKELEYVDFRCYRRYPSIVRIAEETDSLSSREKEFFLRRINGETLDAIGRCFDLSRERVRQIEKKCLRTIRRLSETSLKKSPFDEEYYSYIYTTYDIPTEFWAAYSGVTEQTRQILSMLYKKGSQPFEEAISDSELDIALRIRVSNFLNRNMIFLNGMMMRRNRSELENYVIRTQCKEDTKFEEFVDRYNNTLQANRIPADSGLYISEDQYNSRINHIEDSHICLWKQGKTLRYYDIDSGDYEELYEALGLDDYENTEVSTLKFFEEYPEIMLKYDIQDQYELHNLLRKTMDKAKFPSLVIGRQPMLRFGEFDRNAAIRDLLAVFSPIAAADLENYLRAEYGYDSATLKMTYLTPFARYLSNGIYDIEGNRIPAERMARLKESLTEDFYPIKRIIAIYKQLFPYAQEGEVNARALKELGFKIYTEYALRNYNSMDEYYTHVLTEHDTCSIRDKLRRYSETGTFYYVYKRLKQQYDIFLFEPDRLITRGRLEQFGVTVEEIKAFTDDVFRFVEDGEFFTMHFLREKGFSSSLDRLGFDDIFFTEILTEDPRFAWQRVFGCTVLCKSEKAKSFGIWDFLFSLLSEYESIELDDFLDVLKNDYGIAEPNPYKITELIRENSISLYYDTIMKTIYCNKVSYLSEFDDE